MKISRQQFAENRANIISAAARLFRERGLDQVSLSDVMRDAGLEPGDAAVREIPDTIDGGFAAAHDFLKSQFAESLKQVSASSEFESDYKTRLQELVQKETHAPPDYKIVRTDGPDRVE